MFNLRSWLSDTSTDFAKQYKVENVGKNEIYENILHHIKKTVDFNSASLMVMTEKKKKLKTVAQYNDGCNLIKGIHFKMGSGLSAWLAQKKKIICLPNIHRGARHMHNPIRSYISVPICLKDQLIGMLNLAHVNPNAFGDKEVRTLKHLTQSLASQIYEILNTPVRIH